MKQLLLLTLFVLVSFGTACAQRTVTRAAAPQYRSAAPSTIAVGNQLRQTDSKLLLDTVVTPALNLACADTLTVFIPSAPATGYVSGTNSFFDLEKLQLMELPEATDFTISTGLAAFIVADQSIADRQIFMNVYAYGGAANPLGAFLGSSDTLTVADLTVGTQFTQFPFSTPITLENADAFIIGVEFTNLYFNAQGSIDYVGDVALFATDDGCGNGQNSYEVFRNAEGNLVYSTIFQNWGMLNSEIIVGAVIDRDPFVSTRTPVADYSVVISPNPAVDQVNIRFALSGSETMTASLLSPDGRRVRNRRLAVGATAVSWNVSDLPAGVYLYQLIGPRGVQTGKVVIR